MRAILDVNVVIALLDADHVFHERAHSWWNGNQKAGWASCPITENGVVRIMAHAAYSPKTHFTARELIARLQTFTEHTNHEFWADDISIRDEAVLATERIHGGRQITDLYLLALAVRHRGRLATFDTSIPLSTVPAATAANLTIV